MTTIPLNDLKRSASEFANKLETIAIRVLREGSYLNGPLTKEFCKSFAEYVGVKHCIGVANGTDALEIALRAVLSLDPRFQTSSTSSYAEVVTVANAGGYTTTACHICNCKPVYVDVVRASQLVSFPSIAAALSEFTAAIVVTHLYGGLVDVASLRMLLAERGFGHVPIIEDCAQAHGARGPQGGAGSLGDIATFSFYPTKNLGAFGDGGAIVTNSDNLAEKVAMLRQYGWAAKYHVGLERGRNSRLDELQAALLLARLQHLDDMNHRRRKIFEAYKAAAPANIEFVTSPLGTAAHLAVLLTADRDGLARHLMNLGVSSDVHYPVLDCDQLGWQRLPFRLTDDLSVARTSVGQILTIPCFPGLTDEEVDRVAHALAEYRCDL